MLDRTPRRDGTAAKADGRTGLGVMEQHDWPLEARNRFCVGVWSLLVRCSHSHVEKEEWFGEMAVGRWLAGSIRTYISCLSPSTTRIGCAITRPEACRAA